ncbi:MAG TPA: chemotaxis protein CheA [Spirochaetota bacterium]|nr:chemotaxis protein CheA [Spirochaetota bacterium]
MSDDSNDEFIRAFVSEANDMIEDAEPQIGRIEDSCDKEIVNTVFRMFHSLKGSAGYLNFKNVQNVTHEAENLLDIYRREERMPKAEEIDILYAATDFIKQLIDSVEEKATDQGFENEARIVINDLQQCIKNVRQEIKGAARQQKQSGKRKKAVSGSSGKQASAQADTDAQSLLTEEIIAKYRSEAADLLDRVENNMISLDDDPNNMQIIEEIFRLVHTFKGNSGFLGLAELEKESQELETFLETIRSGKCKVNKNITTFLLSQLDKIKALLEKSSRNIAAAEQNQPEAQNTQAETDNSEHAEAVKPIGEMLVDDGVVKPNDVEKALNMQRRQLGEILIESGKTDPKAVQSALEKQSRAKAAAGSDSIIKKRKDLRVDTDKLDKLFELTGELITAEAMVLNNPALKKLNNEEELPGFNKAANYLNKITNEMQEISMSVRMVPLEGLFNKMTRLVRDLGRKFNKKLKLFIHGAETEMDRTVIEQIADPLVHIMRNCADHGIEDKRTRQSRGKAENGHIYLSAKYEGNEVWITIKDDGRGLDREKILSKAESSGILTKNREEYSDQEVWQLIFNPGFSTAEKITSVSGRGVGMDVVRKNIERMRGKVELLSEKGQGSETILKIPLTMAILDAITFKVKGTLFSLPALDIREFLQPQKEQFTRTNKGRQVIKLREDIIPVVELEKMFKIHNNGNGSKKKKEIVPDRGDVVKEARDHMNQAVQDAVAQAVNTSELDVAEEEKRNDRNTMLIVQSNNRKLAFPIDAIIGSQQIVIKALSLYMNDVKGITGCSILGNGDVTLILDTRSIIERELEIN